MAEPYARGIWARFAPTEHPFDAPTDMEDNLRTIDDHLAIYTLQAPIAPGSSLPASPVNGAGQLFSDGGYAVFNAGGWKVYPPLAGLAVMLANRTDVFVGTGLGWSSLKETLGVTALLAGQGSNIVGKATLADLNGDLGHPAETVAWVLNDVTPANNVLYRKVGAIGAGSWVPASASILGTIQVQLSTALSAIALLQSFQTETAAVLRTGYRPDVALALLDTNGRSPLQVDTFGRLLASFVGNLLGNVTGNVSGTSGGIDGVLWTVQAAQRPDIGLVVRDLNGRGVVLLDSFGRIPALTALLPQDVPYTFAAVARPDVALAVRDELGRGVVVVDAFGRSPSSTGAAATDALQLPEHRDRVLADLVAAGARYRGDFVQDRPYAARDLVRVVDRYWFYVTSSAGSTKPELDAAAEELPVFDRECYIVNDDFEANPGAVAGRYTPEGYVWSVSGAGFTNAVVGSGYMTSAQNTYFVLANLDGPVTEFGSRFLQTSSPLTHTMAMSPNNLAGGFSEMWHTNWTEGALGADTWWSGGLSGQQPVYKFRYTAGLVLTPNVQQECVIKVRGKWQFGYLNGALAFVSLADLIGTLAAPCNAVYVQNHVATLGAEQHHALWVKAAEGPRFGRLALSSEDSTAPLILTAASSPEAVRFAPRGSKCLTKGGAEYRKSTATGNTGWI